jgi:hypothetical protein
MKPLEDQIDDILDMFDFERVKKAMDALNWTWSRCDGVPEIYDLRKCARTLLRDVSKLDPDRASVATGGFWAGYNNGVLSLSFRLDDQDGVFD